MRRNALLCSVALLVILGSAAHSSAALINVDFQGGGTDGVTTGILPGTAVFPAGGATPGTFNFVSSLNFSAANNPLVNSSGGSTGISISGSAPAGNNTQPDSTNAGTTAFQDALVTLNPPFTSAPETGTVTLSGLNGGANYDLYLFGYFNNASAFAGDSSQIENALFTVNGTSTQGTTGATANPGFTLGEDYVKFSGVTPLSGNIITIQFTTNEPNRPVGVFNGLQIVANAPEPGSLLLLGIGLIGLVAYGKRRNA